MKTSSLFKSLLFWNNRSKGVSRSESLSCKPVLESLGDRVLPAAGSISGYIYRDLTGNGLSSDDFAMSHVLVELFRDNNNSGQLNWGDNLIRTEFSSSTGSYSFNNLAAGRYFVTEWTPWGYIRTAPTPSFDYSVQLASGQQVVGQDFDNFKLLNSFAVRNISFTVISPDGTQTTVANLRGNTQQGDTVVANFTIAPNSPPITLSLVSYNAPGASFNASTADEQTILADATGTFGPGQYSLTVQLPNNYYQVDFVAGPAINEFGPAGGTIFYSAQGRLLSADNGGTNALQLGSLTGTVTDSNGNAITGAAVTVTNLANGVQTVVTTSNGTFSVTGLQAGLNYSVTVSDPGFVTQTADVMLLPGANPETFSLVSTTPQLATLTGIVTDGQGNLLQGINVSLTDSQGDFIGADMTDGSGSFTISGIEPGTYILNAIAGDSFATFTTTITLNPGSNTFDITLT